VEEKNCANCLAFHKMEETAAPGYEKTMIVRGWCQRHAPDLCPREEPPVVTGIYTCCEWIARNQETVDDFLRGTMVELLTRFVASQIQVGEAVVPVLKMRPAPDGEPEKGGGREN
jgi:hypothetical protein